MATRATAPWSNGVGRPRTVSEPAPPQTRCIWPKKGGTCGKMRAPKLALCKEHAEVIKALPRASCAWPGCPQGTFHSLCTYHNKLVRGLITKGK